jgi:glycogen debranching enzyme
VTDSISALVGDRRSDTIDLVEGTSFAVSARSGAIGESHVHGLFALDTRLLSRWQIEIDGWPIEPLSFVPSSAFSGTFVSRGEDADQPDSPITLIQRRHVGRGMREDIEVRSHGRACELTVRLHVATDLAGLFDVKAGHFLELSPVRRIFEGDCMKLLPDDTRGSMVEGVVVRWSAVPDSVTDDGVDGVVSWSFSLPDGGTWTTCTEVGFLANGAHVPPSHRCGQPVDEAIPVDRLRTWRAQAPQLRSRSSTLDRAITTAIDDLGALRIFDPEHVDRLVVAAGAPWYMALFGRDSLLASWMALPFNQDLAAGVLAELASMQGARSEALTEEQPGRILHEVRFDRLGSRMFAGTNTYYGTIDATPLFVMLAAELARWTGVTERLVGLMPAVDRAIGWIEQFGDRDGDGFVEYLRANADGLEHQGWKDSWDGIRHADGSIAVPPIALCEVQGYVYAAYRGRAALARALGEGEGAARSFDDRADHLRRRFDEAFWLEREGHYAIGLDGDKRPIASMTSNVGHLLWCGIVADDRAVQLAGRLSSPAMFTGWGLRTLASDSPAYNPLSYHCGSVWPHDTAIAVAGLSRYGLDAEAQAIGRALIDAAATAGGRLPELFGGFDRGDIGAPVPYPGACSLQAWASAAPMLLVRAMLGLEPDVPSGRIALRPRLATDVGPMALRGVLIGGHLVDIEADGDTAEVSGIDLHVHVS